MPVPNERLRRERQLRGWSQAYLAKQIDNNAPDYYISRWERGDVSPSPYYQQKLCEVFGKTAEELGLLQAKAPPSPAEAQQPDKDSLSSFKPPTLPTEQEVSAAPI